MMMLEIMLFAVGTYLLKVEAILKPCGVLFTHSVMFKISNSEVDTYPKTEVAVVIQNEKRYCVCK